MVCYRTALISKSGFGKLSWRTYATVRAVLSRIAPSENLKNGRSFAVYEAQAYQLIGALQIQEPLGQHRRCPGRISQ